MVNNDDDFLKSLLGGLKKLEPKPTPTRPAPSIYTRPDLENILRQAGWPEEHVPYMTEMALKESSGDPGATRVRRAGEGQKLPESSYGLWQINTLANPQYDPQKLATDPVYNAKAALDVYKKQGFDAWLNSKRRLAAQGILPGQVKASAPAAPTTVSDDEFRAHLESLISPASPEVDDNFKQKIETLITGTATTPTNPAPGYAPVNTNTLDNSSIPSNRPTLQPRKNKVAAPIKAKPKAPVGEGTVTVDVGNLTPIDTSAGQFVDTGVQVDLPRQAGKATDSNGIAAKVTVNVQGVPTAEKLDYSIRKAYESVATKFDLTPDQIEQGIKLGRQYKVKGRIDDDTTEGTIWITLKDLENIKGKDAAQTDERMRQAQSRVGIEQIPPENLLTPEVINALKASTITPTEALETPWIGMEDEQNIIAGALRTGGSAWRDLAGLYRAADDLWHRPFGEGHRLINPSKFEDIKAYQGDDIYKYMSSIAATSEAPAEKLAKYGGTRAEIFQMAGALPGDLSRIMLLSKLPGGMITGMSADMAAQSAGRGEHFDKVASEAFKGAIFGSIAKYAGPVGEKWMAGLEEAGFSSAASKLGGGAATLAFTGAATYPVSRASGADPKTALKETIFNTIFSLGDAVSVLAGRTVRAKDPAGNEVAFQIDPQGNAKEVQVPKGEVADVEILSPYNKQELAASNKIIEEMNRPMSELIREADLTVDGPDAIAANPQATAVLNHLLKNIAEEQGNAGSYRDFHGLPLYANYSGAFIKQLENMLDQAQLAKDASSMVEISNLIAKINDVTKRTAGEAGLYTKYEGLDDITQGTKAEERVHIRNERFGVTAQTPKLLEKPSVQKVFDIIKGRDPNRKDTYAMDEVIAQTFRPKAEEHLGLTTDEIKQTLKDVFRVLAENNENTLQYASSLKDVSPAATKFARRGHLLNLYARRKQQQPVAGGKPSEVSAAGSNTPGVRGRGAGPGIRHSSPDTRGTAERGSGTGPGGEGPIEPRFSQVTDRTELERRAARAIQELEELQAKGAPTREQIGEILGNPEHSYGRSPRGAIFDLKDALETGAELPLGDKRAWVDVPETAVKAGAEARNQEIFEEVTAAPAAPKKTGKYVPNPNAVERGSVLEDGKIWVQGQQVFPTDESVAVVRAMAEHNNALITEKLKELDQLKRSGQVTREQLDSVIGEDHRFGTDVDAAIRDYESVLLDNGMYLQDIAEANTAYNTHQVAKQVKTKAPKESTPKAKEPSTPVAKEDPWSVQSREAHLKNVQAINKKLGIKEWQPPAKPDPNIEAWKQRQRLAELSDTRPAADKTVDEIVDRDVRQAYKDAGGDQFKAVEGVLKRYEQDAINMQSSGSALFQKKIEALRNKYGPILEFNKRRASGGSIDPQFAQLKHGSRHLFKPEVLVEGPNGERKYIEGEQKKFPVGTRVSRRGENIIVRTKPEKGMKFRGKGLYDSDQEISIGEQKILQAIEQQVTHPKRPKSIADSLSQQLKTAEHWRDNNTHAPLHDYISQNRAVEFIKSLKPEDFAIPSKRAGRELHSVDSWLPQIPEGYKVIEKYPLGRIRDDKINTGEGSQFRGYGHYAAETHGVASTYRQAGIHDNANPRFLYDGKEFDYNAKASGASDADSLRNGAIMGTFTAMDNNRVDAKEAIQNQIDWYETEIARFEEADKAGQLTPGMAITKLKLQYYRKVVEAYQQLDPDKFDIEMPEPHPGYLYHIKTNVKDEDLLHLDRQIKDQGEHIQDIAREFDNSRGYDFYDADNPSVNDPVSRTGEQLYKRMSREFDRTTQLGLLSKKGGGDVLASEFLKDKGIKGLKFLDQNSRKPPEVLYSGKPTRFSGQVTPKESAIAWVAANIENQINNGKPVDIEAAKTEAINWAYKTLTGEWDKQKLTELQALNTADFTVKYPKKQTHNHVIFKGEDIDVSRIQFAQALKDKRVFDKKAVDEVSAFTDENFPQLAAFWKPRKSTGTPLATNPNPVAAERMAKARGMDVETSPQKIADRIVNIYREFKRQFKEIDPNESVQMARTADSFRLLSSLNSWAKTQATNDVARIIKPLSREQYDVFENVLILRDKKKAVEQGMKPGHGYIDLADVEKSLKEYEDAAKADPAISKALADREALRRKTVGDLVKIDMLGEQALNNDSYFHRQVPQGGENNLFLSMGNRDLRVRKKGFEKKRTGDGDDYNTNYVEAEVEWLSQAHAQIRKYELLQEIKRAVDISDDLKLQAKIQGVDWHTLVDKSTHRIWQPQEGSYFYKVMSAPDELLTDIFSGKHTLSTAEAELREALARGQKKPEWVLPSGVAKLMDNFEVQPHENAIKQTTASAMASWKQWALINPKNYLSYNIRNFISDLDAAMAYPGIIKELPAAIKDIYKYSRDKNHAAAAEIEQAIKDGVMDSGQTFAEIPDISKLGVFKIFADSDTNVLSRGLNKVWDAMKNSSNARENWIRLAAYRHIKQRLANGDVIYGASNRGQVDALAGNPGRQAAKIARELVGDYGGISEAGRAIRKHMMPFYSWCVPTTTEILTRDGWKAHDELALGEEVLTYNIETRTTEWQPVQDKAVLDYDGPLVTLNNSFGHKYQFTPDHRCVVIEQYKDKRKVVLAKDLKSHHKLPVVAPHEFSTGSVLNETEAALLGFLVTDGYFRTRKESPNSFEAVLYQKKPGEVQWIRDTFKDYISSESVHPQTGVICFRLSAPKISKIRSVFQTKEDLPSVITRLGQAECRAMYDAMMRAEGSSANGATQFPQNRGPVLDGFQILCYMLGKAGHIRDKRGGTGHAALYVKGRDKISVHKWQRTEEQYTGQVWCPKTANSTWIMRQDGKVMITGNCEINAPRYVRMIANIPNEAGGKSRLAGMAGTKVAGKVALVGTKRAAQLMAITAAINAWNHLVFPDLEDQLMKTDVGKRPHLIVGTNPDGTARVFQADTALRDAMDWFDAGDIVSDISEVRDGRATVIDKIAEGVKAPVNRVVQALGPIKTAGEFVFGESTYPDIFEKKTSFALKSRPIRDRAEYLAQAFAMKGIYQRVMGRPTPPASGPIGQLSDWFLTMRVDPEESIFWNIRGRVSDYKKKMGKSTGGTDPTEKSNTLFYYKQAIRWGNQEAAERYLRQYKEEFGGTDKGLQQSLDRTHPLGQLAKSDWPEFIKQLTPDERDQLKVAIGYYDEKFKSGPGATPAKDTTVEELLQMTFPGKGQEDIDRMVEAERRKEQADAQREANKKARGLR